MTSYDIIIIGAGPAGLQLSYCLQQQGISYLVLELGPSPATFFHRYPRHSKLLSINKVHTGYDDAEIALRWRWNDLLCQDGFSFTDYSRDYFPTKDDLVAYLQAFAERFHLNIQYNTTIETISKARHFELRDTTGRVFHGDQLVVATGLSQPYMPPIPGIEHAELYTQMPIDPESFTNQRVLIIGKGNSAFETGDNLVATASRIHLISPHPLTLAWSSHYVGHLRAVNNNLLDTYQLKSQNAILDATVECITYHNGQYTVQVRYAHADGETECLVYDRVLVCTGFRFDTSPFDASCRPQLTRQGRLPAQTSEWESVNVRDLYFAGTLMQARDYRRTTSAFIHGFRYNIQALAHILACKYHQGTWPYCEVDCDAQALTDHVIERINTSSALWHQFGFLADVVVLSEDERTARCYIEVPVDYVRHSALAPSQSYYLITLEYGPNPGTDILRASRIHRDDVEKADQSRFLHPLIRRYNGALLASEHHVIEDLEAEWREAVHIEPLRQYFQRELHELSGVC